MDYCDTFYYEPTQADADFELRGFDRPENANGSPGVSGGTFDIGYDEVWPLFADGFESGTTSAWSSSVP